MRRLIGVLFGILCVVRTVRCWERYQNLIPNGYSIPSPCGGIWSGVGHDGPGGQGPRNPFGLDFKKANATWTVELCKKDSDGDGMLNGWELGDPWCRWTVLSPPTALLPARFHPGLCEPWDSPLCRIRQKNGTLLCEDNQKCLAAYQPDVRKFQTRLPLTRVPTNPFTYACMVFNVPSKRNYHMVEAKPIFYNRRVLHHMTLYACDSMYTIGVSNKPFECPRVTTAPCQKIITSYTSNFPITCLHENVGILFGKDGIKQIVLQVLWSNPASMHYLDSSGMEIYLSPQLRTHTAGFATLDSTVFTIPPGILSYPVMGGCPGECTSMRIVKEVFITMGINLMHRLGRRQRVELIRNNTIIDWLTNSEKFNYTQPDVFRHLNPIQVLPGDSLRMICEYDSTAMTSPVNRGLSQNEEICRAQLMYYPEANWIRPTCLGYKHVPLCKFETTGEAFDCNYQAFINNLQNHPQFNTTIRACGTSGTCSTECLHLVSKERQHPCLQGELYELWKSNLIGRPDPRMVVLYKALVPCERLYEENAHLVTSRVPTAP